MITALSAMLVAILSGLSRFKHSKCVSLCGTIELDKDVSAKYGDSVADTAESR